MIKTFGSDKEQVQTCDVVDLLLKTRDGENLQLTFLVVPMICDPLAWHSLSHAVEMFPYLSKLELADVEGEFDIDVLIGSDLYWRLVTGRVVRGENGPTAIETVFGWVLSGPVDMAPEAFVLTSTHMLRIDFPPTMITSTPSYRGSGIWKPSALRTVSHRFMTSL